MKFLGKLFGRPDHRTRLERFVDELSAASMNRRVSEVSDDVKVSYALALTVLVFARQFTKGLREFADELPEPFRTSWPFPYDRILAEIAGFYFFVVIRELEPQPSDGEDDEDEDEDEDDHEDEPGDPYLQELKRALYLCSKLVQSLTDLGIADTFVAARATSYVHIRRRGGRGNVIETLQSSIWRWWNPKHDGRPVELSAPTIPLHAQIAHIPIDELTAACKEEVYEAMR